MIATTCPSRPANVPIAISIPRPSNYWTRGRFKIRSIRIVRSVPLRKVAAQTGFRKRTARVIIADDSFAYSFFANRIPRGDDERSMVVRFLSARKKVCKRSTRSLRNRFRLACWLEEVQNLIYIHIFLEQINSTTCKQLLKHLTSESIR